MEILKTIKALQSIGDCKEIDDAVALIVHQGERIAELEEQQRWIPVTERLPKVVSTHKHRRYIYQKSTRVLCVCAQKGGKRMVKEGYCEWYQDYPEPRWRVPGTIDSVTHWMPLPEAPKEA